jgi:low affinity Fe/Cu permease
VAAARAPLPLRCPVRNRNVVALRRLCAPKCKERIVSDDRGRIQKIGCHVSSLVADVAADPFAQVGFVLLCLIWFWLDLNVNILTAALSILAITLTQMVLNSQQERERDAHRRDVALHAKLDELLLASRRARNELAGIEELEEEEIAELKNGGTLPGVAGPRAA